MNVKLILSIVSIEIFYSQEEQSLDKEI